MFLSDPLVLLGIVFAGRRPSFPCWLSFLLILTVFQRYAPDSSIGSFFSRHVGWGLGGTLPLCVGDLFRGQILAKWPNFLHFLHWFGSPKLRILWVVVSPRPAPSAMEGIRIIPASLLMSLTSTEIKGPVDLLMYESGASISSTSPILLAMMVNTFSERSYTCRSENCTRMVCVRSFSAPWLLGLKSAEYFEKESAQPFHLTAPSFLVALAPSSSSNRTSK